MPGGLTRSRAGTRPRAQPRQCAWQPHSSHNATPPRATPLVTRPGPSGKPPLPAAHLVEVALPRLQAGQHRRVKVGGSKAVVPGGRSAHVARAVTVLPATVRAQQRWVWWVLQQRLCRAQGDGRRAAAAGSGREGRGRLVEGTVALMVRRMQERKMAG